MKRGREEGTPLLLINAPLRSSFHPHGRNEQAIQRDELENHAKAVVEGMQALSWVVVKPAPRDFIENFVGAADFWGNKASKGKGTNERGGTHGTPTMTMMLVLYRSCHTYETHNIHNPHPPSLPFPSIDRCASSTRSRATRGRGTWPSSTRTRP